MGVVVTLSACSSNYTTYTPEQTIDTDILTIKVKDSNNYLLNSDKNNSPTNLDNKVRNNDIYFDIKSKIMNQYADWKGVRYRFGGTSKHGIDCSAFVQRTFREQFGLNLPRSTFYQKKIGLKIQRTKLRPGDIVLFAGSKGRHVGIYVGNGNDEFVHASASNGVIISSLNERYWNNHYQEGRRVLMHGVQSSS